MHNFLIILQQNISVLYVLVILLGLCVGSFLNVVIHRLPIMLQTNWQQQCRELLQLPKTIPYRKAKYIKTHSKNYILPASFNLCFPPSHCPKCNFQLKIWHNIPLLSYFLLKGRCVNCQQKISFRYPVIEGVTALLSILIIYKFGLSWQGLGGLIFVWFLIPLSIIDFDYQFLPDNLTIPLLWLGLLFNITQTFTNLADAVISTVIGYLVLWLFIKLYYLVTGKIGMGEGDFKLFAAFGAWFGWQKLPFIIILASLIGTIVGIILLKLHNKSQDTPIPFGPFLALAAIMSLLFGQQIINGYLWLLLKI